MWKEGRQQIERRSRENFGIDTKYCPYPNAPLELDRRQKSNNLTEETQMSKAISAPTRCVTFPGFTAARPRFAAYITCGDRLKYNMLHFRGIVVIPGSRIELAEFHSMIA
jgi:hypothetical protein